MPLPQPEPGLVIRYSFLFSDGQEKERPALIITSVTTEPDGRLIVRVSSITHTPPEADNEAESVEIPPAIKNHLKLDHERSWIRLNEINRFEWPGYDLRAIKPGKFDYGFLPPKFFKIVRDQAVALDQARAIKMTKRDD